MKQPTELQQLFSGEVPHKKRSTALKRVAGGIRTEIESQHRTGLTKTELKALTDAVHVLETLAGNFAKSASLEKNRASNRAKLDAQCKEAMKHNFGALTSIEDQVALIGAANSRHLREGRVNDMVDLEMYFKDAIMFVSLDVIGKVNTKEPMNNVVAEAWEKFTSHRAVIEAKHQHVIDKLKALPK